MYIILKDGNTSDVKSYVNRIENACGDLPYNFSCVVVLDKKSIVRQSDIDLFFNTVDLIYAYGADRIILVKNNNNDFDFFQTNLLNFKTCFTVENAMDIQEAEYLLDQRQDAINYNLYQKENEGSWHDL
jgi:predicted transglutaminase-like protease